GGRTKIPAQKHGRNTRTLSLRRPRPPDLFRFLFLRGFLDYVGSREGWKAKILSLDSECLVWVDEKLADNPLCRKYRDEVEKAEAVFIAQFYD
ncbi:hypothetical protein ACNQT2_11340, partial [Corynebacterium diphtheriae]